MKLSILIPSKNEPHLQRTLDDLNSKITEDTEVLWMEDPGIGQRACINELALKAKGDYVMKCDAHVSFAPGFDTVLLSEIDDRTILAPQMGVLNPETWTINGKKMTTRYCFDPNFVMHYDEENGDEETMCLQGSAWMVSKENYWNWQLVDNTLGSWGGQAVELGIKAFLNGGRCKSTRKTYYGHVFRHSDSDFPYDRGDNPGKFATEELRRKYIKSIAPLIKKFNYPAGWTPELVEELCK